MNLAEMLSYADIHELSKIASNYECKCSSHSKNELIQSILLTMGRKEVFEQQVELLGLEDLRFLNSLLFDGQTTYSLEELIARSRQTKFATEEKEEWNPRDTIMKFKQRGWLFNGFSLESKYLFQMPRDLKNKFSEALCRQFQKKICMSTEPSVYRDEQMLIVEDIQIFLKEIDQQPLPLTNSQFLYKRQLQQILNQFSIQESLPQKEPWRFGYGRKFKEYPGRFSLIYDYCYYHGLINENGNSLELSDKGRANVREGMKAHLADVYRLWLRLYKNAVPRLQSIVFWVERLSRDWATCASLESALCPLIKPYYYDTSQAILEKRIFQMMMHLGLLRIGEDEINGRVVQISKLGSSIIQGTYVKEDDTIKLPDNDIRKRQLFELG